MSKKLTAWFPGEVKPARSGVYQQRDGRGKAVGYQRWNGSHWYEWVESKDAAAATSFPAASRFQNDPWRGLAKEPK